MIASFWALPAGSTQLIVWVLATLVVSLGLFFLLTTVPTNLRRPIVMFFTFIAGFVFVAHYLWPKPLNVDYDSQLPANGVESVGFFLGQAIEPIGKIANILASFMLGLGIFSLVRVHLNKVRRKQVDWGFSIVLLVSFVVMAVTGLWDWSMRLPPERTVFYSDEGNWTGINRLNDLLFDGLYQQMEAAMFSIIAFFILSAAYRAFRIRSVEATIMMASALLLMLNLMGLLTFYSAQTMNTIADGAQTPFLLNFQLTEVANWLRSTMQIPAIRAIEFGVGLGALAMGLRLWLGLEKGGVSA